MIVSIPAALLAFQLAAATDGVPNFDLDPTCARTSDIGVMVGRTKEACIRDEQKARDQLRADWPQFSSGDRLRCTQSTSMGGVPSYVELQTCLEISKAARDLPDETVGRAPSR